MNLALADPWLTITLNIGQELQKVYGMNSKELINKFFVARIETHPRRTRAQKSRIHIDEPGLNITSLG